MFLFFLMVGIAMSIAAALQIYTFYDIHDKDNWLFQGCAVGAICGVSFASSDCGFPTPTPTNTPTVTPTITPTNTSTHCDTCRAMR